MNNCFFKCPLKVFKIWWWWNFTIKKDEFHPSLDIDLLKIQEMDKKEIENYKKQIVTYREIAHYLNDGSHICELEYLLKKI